MQNYSNLQMKVLERAKELLQTESWFRGVCVDTVPDDKQIQSQGLEECAIAIVFETAMWDDPSFYD